MVSHEDDTRRNCFLTGIVVGIILAALLAILTNTPDVIIVKEKVFDIYSKKYQCKRIPYGD